MLDSLDHFALDAGSSPPYLLSTALPLGLPTPWPWLALLLVLFATGAIVIFSIRRMVNRNLEQLADRFNLTRHPQPARFALKVPVVFLSGRHRGREVLFYSYRTNQENDGPDWTGIAVGCRGVGDLVMENARKTLLGLKQASVAQRLYVVPEAGAPGDVKAVLAPYEEIANFAVTSTGDDGFDHDFTLRTNRPKPALALLSADVRERLLVSKSNGGRLAVNDNLVQFIYLNGFFNTMKMDRVATQLDFICDLAERIET